MCLDTKVNLAWIMNDNSCYETLDTEYNKRNICFLKSSSSSTCRKDNIEDIIDFEAKSKTIADGMLKKFHAEIISQSLKSNDVSQLGKPCILAVHILMLTL